MLQPLFRVACVLRTAAALKPKTIVRPHGATQLGNAATVAQMPAAAKQGGHHDC